VAKASDNLIPQAHVLTLEEQSAGGIASGIARREKATMLATLEKCLEEKNQKSGKTYKELATLGLIKGAVNGNGNNYKIIQELMEKQERKEETSKVVVYIPAKDLGKAYVDVNRDIDERGHFEYWFEGGRGSIKSSYWSEKVAELLENNPNMCALLIRKVGNTMKDSVFSQMQWGIDKLGETYPSIPEHWKATKSPLEITNTNTGQIIYFRGADDPVKIKSIKPPKNKYIGIVVYEEFDQMNGMEEVGTIDRSVIRGGEDFIVFRVYNTPTSSQHFVNVEKRNPKKDRLVHRSTYKDVPKKWLGQKFFDEAEYMLSINERQYKNVYLGEETGSGGNVFENIELREITDDEINSFDYIYQGLDFGWFPDPLAWTKCSYNPSQRTLYIFDEFVVNKMSNADVWEHLKSEKGVVESDLIIADSAEPKSIGDFRMWGSCMRGAEKGAGSVEYSMKWLSSLAKIVIDQRRCPTAAQEFSTYEFEQDKDGNYISGYVDANNHTIDSVRYALNNIWRKRGQ
jgi:PBSX family phage terminase large subunit